MFLSLKQVFLQKIFTDPPDADGQVRRTALPHTMSKEIIFLRRGDARCAVSIDYDPFHTIQTQRRLFWHDH